MSGNESPGADDSLSLSSSSSVATKSITTVASSSSSISQLDPKYKNYVAAVDKALKSFEYTSEWHDLISALSKLNKVITTWSAKYGADLPRLHLVTKRLSQCLHPNLPGGVHLKTLETYELIFKSIPVERTSSVIEPDLFSFASGLFPLWTYASEQSRPTLLRIYETYLLPLIKHPALEGFLISILSGLSEDDNSSATTPTIVTDDPMSTMGRVNNLLENVTANVGVQNFNRVLWQVLKANSRIRLSGINYVHRKSAITDDESLAVDTLTCCLVSSDSTNESVLVQRATLELLLNHFQLPDLEEEKKTKLIKASLQTLLRRDMSLNRRLFNWLLGNDPNYFENHCKQPLITGCKEILTENSLSSSEIVRILISLLDKPEISILDDILLQIVIYFRRIDSKQCANLFFVNLKPEYVFDQVVTAIEANVEYCSLLGYLIELDLSCFEYEKLLPGVFRSLVKLTTSSNIKDMEPVLKLILKKIELDPIIFEAFIEFYLRFVDFYPNTSNESKFDFDFDKFVKPKVIENFWTDFKLCGQNCDRNIFEKFCCGQNQSSQHTFENLSVVNELFEELLDPRILKEIPDVTDWLKTLIVISCNGDVETISLLVKVLKLLEKPLCFEIVEETYLIELATRFLWEQDQFETLSELICLNKLKVEKIVLSFLQDVQSFRKLVEFLDFVGDFGEVKLLVYKLVENLDCTFEQNPLEFLELREQAEEFCCKMLRENDLRFLDVFISNLLIDMDAVGEYLSRIRKEKERNSLRLGSGQTLLLGGNGDGNADLDVDRISIGIGSVSDLTSECSYKSIGDLEDNDEENAGALKATSTPDLTNLSLTSSHEDNRPQVFSRSLCDLTQISEAVGVKIPEIVVRDQHGDQCSELAKDESDSVTVAIAKAMKLPLSPLVLTPSTELATEARAKSTPSSKGFSKKLSHPHLKVCKDLSEDVQNRILYVLSKLEKLLMLKPDLFISYLKTCNTNQSARINFREDCVYLELLIGKLLDFMCLLVPNADNQNRSLLLNNLNVQFKSCSLLRLLLDKVIECERVEFASTNSGHVNSNEGGGTKPHNFNQTPANANGFIARRQNILNKLRRKSSTSTSGSHFVTDMLTRAKVQRTLLFVLRSTSISFDRDELGACSQYDNRLEQTTLNAIGTEVEVDVSVDLIKLNYGQKYLTIYQGLLLSLMRTVISLESLLNSIQYHYYTSSSKTLSSLNRNHNHHKYLAFLPLTNQPLFHEILLTALELRNDNSNHYNWMDLNLQILPYIINTNCPMTILSVTQICRNLQNLRQPCTPQDEIYILRCLDYLIAITNAVLFRPGDKPDKPEEAYHSQSSSSIYGIITSFLPGSSSTSPKIECTDEVDNQSKDLLSKLDILVKTSLAVQSVATINKLRNLLNPICNNYLENFLTSLSILEPNMKLTELCQEIETIRVEKLTIICTRALNRNLLIFYRDFVQHIESIEFSASLLNALVKECSTKSVGLVTICEIVNDLYNKFKPESWSKQELRELQENIFKIFDRLVVEVSTQNSLLLLDSNSVESSSSSNGQVTFMTGQGLQGKGYNFKKVTTSEDNIDDILSSLSINLPNLVDLLWTDDKDRDKVMPMLAHLLTNLMGVIKLRHTSTSSYVSILKLLKNMSYYSYFRKAWKKEVFEMLLLEPGFFQMIKPHYYYCPTIDIGIEVSHPEEKREESRILENKCVIQIWRVIMDNLFTQDKSSFSELLTRVSVPQTTSLNIFTSKDTEFEGRALLLKRLAFVIWSSEQDQFCKFITNIQERLAEALKTPNSSQIVPVILLKSVFLCFRVLVLRFSNMCALWPIVIHEVVQVMLHLEKQLMSGSRLDQDHLNCALEVFKLIELLANLPTGDLPLFQMYRWAFVPNCSVSSEENLLENNNINNGFIPFLSRISILVDEPSNSDKCRDPNVSKRINPSRMRTLSSLSDVYEFLNGHCDTISVDELCQELDLDFIEC